MRIVYKGERAVVKRVQALVITAALPFQIVASTLLCQHLLYCSQTEVSGHPSLCTEHSLPVGRRQDFYNPNATIH